VAAGKKRSKAVRDLAFPGNGNHFSRTTLRPDPVGLYGTPHPFFSPTFQEDEKFFSTSENQDPV
jgi:hypothetical protein